MSFIADLHIHSHLSRATSPENRLDILSAWAHIKGIQVLASGDFSHPEWYSEIRENLVEAEPGLYKIKNPKQISLGNHLKADTGKTRFILCVEISSIYKKNNRVYKNHNLVFAPDLVSAAKINAKLAAIGNIESDGRPILGLDARHLLEIILEISEQAYLVPAHIWTPWFSLLGSKSGFNSVEECFEDLTSHIFALETGLSSDPDMNWMVSSLDRYSLISNSDSHSPEKLGREANLFNCPMDYFSLFKALKTKQGFSGTIEFFPEEGKYHFDGHRKCHVMLHPEETKKHHSLCPVCGKELTIGVMNRVWEIADRKKPEKPNPSGDFHHLIPLKEVAAETLGISIQSKKTGEEYGRLISQYGSEFNVLHHLPETEFEHDSNPLLKEAIHRMREGNVIKEPGYDGEYGIIKIFREKERENLLGQGNLFSGLMGPKTKAPVKSRPVKKELNEPRPVSVPAGREWNQEQKLAVENEDPALIITAGPGTGKTWTMTKKIASLVLKKNKSPESILAITFTNRAVNEMKTRLQGLLGKKADSLTVCTIHRLCLSILEDSASSKQMIVDGEERMAIMHYLFPDLSSSAIQSVIGEISLSDKMAFSHTQNKPQESETGTLIKRYKSYLNENNLLDLDSLIFKTLSFLTSERQCLEKLHEQYAFIFVDEFQDLDASQYELIKLLKGKTASICVIGDPDQSIYGWRGASPAYFNSFPKDFKADQIALVRNYRNSPSILKGALSVLPKKDRDQAIHPVTDVDFPIQAHEAASEKAEAEFVIHTIEKMVGGISFFSLDSGRTKGDSSVNEVFAFNDMAVLYRTRTVAQTIHARFLESGIPVQWVGEAPYYLSPPLEEVTAFLRVCFEPGSFSSWQKFLHTALNLPRKTVKKFLDLIQEKRGDKSGLNAGGLFTCLQDLAPSKKDLIASFQKTALEMEKDPSMGSIKNLLMKNSSLLKISSGEGLLKRFLNLMDQHETIHDFLEYIRENPTQTYDEKAQAVTLMSLHASKGLEFGAVFIIGCEEDIIPYNLRKDPSNQEEEQRLFYVGMTRAKKCLYLTCSRKRTLFGKTKSSNPSPLIKKIPSDCLSVITPVYKAKKKNLQMELPL